VIHELVGIYAVKIHVAVFLRILLFSAMRKSVEPYSFTGGKENSVKTR
jgi:hypothetical protein